MALGMPGKVSCFDICNTPFVNISGRNVAGGD
jgi:hypothetical protein